MIVYAIFKTVFGFLMPGAQLNAGGQAQLRPLTFRHYELRMGMMAQKV